jgi:hypothetical protein
VVRLLISVQHFPLSASNFYQVEKTVDENNVIEIIAGQFSGYWLVNIRCAFTDFSRAQDLLSQEGAFWAQ